MKLTLEREITAIQWRVLATIGFNQSRPELIAILALSKELSDGIVTGRDVSSRLLAGRPESVGDRLLKVCHMMKLIEAAPGRGGGWCITELGERSLLKKEVPAPQRGEFDIWVIDDPLFPDVIARVRATELDIQSADEISNIPPSEGIPRLLRGCENKIISPPVRFEGEPNEVCVFDFSGKCRVMEREAGHAKLEMEENGGRTIFAILGRTFSTTLELPSLADTLSQIRWRGSGGVKSVSFRELSDDDRRKGSRDESPGNVHLRELGNFDSCTLKGVELIPKSQQDADEWAEWRLLDRINDYIWPEDYQNLIRKVRELSVQQGWRFDPALPPQLELARKSAGNVQAERRLLVPLEWDALRLENSDVRHAVLVLSGRTTAPREIERVLEKCGGVPTRFFLLMPETENVSEFRLPNEVRDACVARTVHQPPDAWVLMKVEKRIGEQWIYSKKSESGKNKRREPETKLSSGTWHDLRIEEIDGVIRNLGRAFWKKAKKELDVYGNWIAVKQR